eukprot:gene10788-13203_t
MRRKPQVRTRRRLHADDQPADPEAAGSAEGAGQGSCSSVEPAEAWCVHPRLHHDPEEAARMAERQFAILRGNGSDNKERNAEKTPQKRPLRLTPIFDDEDQTHKRHKDIAEAPPNGRLEGKDQKLNSEDKSNKPTNKEADEAEYFHNERSLIFETCPMASPLLGSRLGRKDILTGVSE